MKKIAIIGPYSLPYEGISIFVKRFLTLLDSKEIPYEFIATGSKGLMKLHIWPSLEWR